MFNLISNQHVIEYAIEVINHDIPNKFLETSHELDADLFYIYKFAQIIDNSGIDGYLFGYCGDDLHNVFFAANKMHLNSILRQLETFYKRFPTIKKVTQPAEYLKILSEASIELFSDACDFSIQRRVLDHEILEYLSNHNDTAHVKKILQDVKSVNKA